MLFAEWHLDVEALLRVLHGERLKIKSRRLIILKILGTLVAANNSLRAAGRHTAILTYETLLIMQYSEAALRQQELELQRAVAPLVLYFLLQFVV